MSQVRHERGGWYSAVRRNMVVPLASSTLGIDLFSSTSHNLGAHQGAQVTEFFRPGGCSCYLVFAHAVKWAPIPRFLGETTRARRKTQTCQLSSVDQEPLTSKLPGSAG